MKCRYLLFTRTTAAALLITFFLVLLALVPAQASSFGSFVGFLKDLEDEVEPVTVEQMGFPLSTDEMWEAEGLVNCLVDANNDYDVAVCADDFGDSELGKKINNESGVASEIGMLIDCYILYSEGAYWSLAWKLSNVAACVVVRVLVGGVDVCGIVQEILDLASDVYHGVAAALEWLLGAGEAILDFFGWGDDEPKTPRHMILLNHLLSYLNDGLDEKKKVVYTYDAWLDNLKKQVLDSVNKPLKEFNEEHKDDGFLQLPLYTQSHIDQAAAKFTPQVNAVWTADIQQHEKQRRQVTVDGYFAYSPKIKELATMVIDQCAANTSCSAKVRISKSCENAISFTKGWAFAHIDRWKTANDLKVPGVKEAQDFTPSNYQVCESAYALKRTEFIAAATDYLEDQELCKENEGFLTCSSIDAYNQCTNIMHAFENEGTCYYNAKELAAEAKLKIMVRFREMGSNFYSPKNNLQQNVQVMKKNDLTMKKKGAEIYTAQPFPCYRPTHVYYFNQVYKELYGNVPTQLLTADKQYSFDYEQLVTSTEKTINQLRQNPELEMCTFTISPIDPLMVETSDFFCAGKVQETNPEFTLRVASPGLTIDGQNNPVLYFDQEGILEKMGKPLMSSKIDISGPVVDPILELQNKQTLQLNDTLGSIRKGSDDVKMKQAGTTKNIETGKINAPAAGTKLMSGQVPDGGKLPGSTVAKMQLQQTPARLEIMPISSMYRVGRPVYIKVKNSQAKQVDFILQIQSVPGPFKAVVRPSAQMRQEGDLVLLSLDLDEPGQYRIRFRQKNSGPWGAWSNFRVTGGPRQTSQSTTAGRMINPQPEPPGKPQIGQAQQIRLQPPQVLSPRNGEHFRMHGSSIVVTIEVEHSAKEKPEFEFQIKEKNRFTEVKPRLRLQQGAQRSKAVLTLDRPGEYRFRTGAPPGKWSGWQGFFIDQLNIQKPMTMQTDSKNKGSGSVAPLPIKPRIQ